MRTRFISFVQIALATLAAGVLHAQEATPEPAVARPEKSDPEALQIIRNYLKASGGEAAHRALGAVRVEAFRKEKNYDTRIEIYETRDAVYQRTKWRFLGREYERIVATDGTETWRQEIKPEQLAAVPHGEPLRHQFLFPFLEPDDNGHVFEFAGKARTFDRPAYLVIGHSPADVRTWYYFDRETFLVVRHGGEHKVAHADTTLDSGTVRFKPVAGVQLPSEAVTLIEGQVAGKTEFKKVAANPELDPALFTTPEKSVWLRQYPD